MEEDERREAAIAFRATSLRSDLKPKSNSITSSQLSKFQELHRRRLKIKAKSKISKKPQGNRDGNEKFEKTDVVTKNWKKDESSSLSIEDSSAIAGNTSSKEQVESGALVSTKKRHKLHWGLDTKERWEMKANM